MGKLKKKGQAGTAVLYVTRNQAMKRLQVTLKDFRRLCILKGIYPREPRNKKALSRSTTDKTYYLAKDVMFLAHEPVLKKFREFKAFMKKLRRAIAKNEPSIVRQLKLHKPVYTLDHLIRERYPTFMDALHELDDALCLIFLFAQIPKSDTIQSEVIEDCRRLSKEFMSYVVQTHCLHKVFLSIKGIYYQVNLMGQQITWTTPYAFSQHVPKDVDYKIMLTFLEFYRTLLSFVNHKLYTDLNLYYPPRFDAQKDACNAGLSAVILEPIGPSLSCMEQSAPLPNITESQLKAQQMKSEARLKTLGAKIQSIEEEECPSAEDPLLIEDDTAGAWQQRNLQQEEDEEDEFVEEKEETAGILEKVRDHEKDAVKLFRGFVFFLNREVPKESLEFVIKSFGGEVAWEDVSGLGFMMKEEDSRITHHVIDRHQVQKPFKHRDYVQPQYIYDCVNSRTILPTFKYAPNVILPPHLSPFVEKSDKEYDPLAPFPKREKTSEEALHGATINEKATELEEAHHHRELKAEAAGLTYFDYQKEPPTTSFVTETKKMKSATKLQESKKLAKIMMSKKDRRLYQRIQYGQRKKDQEIKRLQKKREQIDASKKNSKF